MSSQISQTLIRLTKSPSTPTLTLSLLLPRPPSAALVASTRGYCIPPEPAASPNNAADWEEMAAQRIENAVHQIIMIKSVPDWLPFVPGGSYWVPPKRRINGLNQLVNKIANPLTEEEYLSLTNVRGWPSSGFCASPEMETSTSFEPLLKDLKSKAN